MRKIQVITSASGNGGTTFARNLASRLDVPFHELDALFWGPSWAETPAEEFRARIEPLVAGDAWVIDGSYHGKLGDLVRRHADVVVWLDQPMDVWLPRLVRRTLVRIVRRETLWNGNRETFLGAFLSRDSVLLFAVRHYRRRRRELPERLARCTVVRLRSPAEVERFLRSVGRAT